MEREIIVFVVENIVFGLLRSSPTLHLSSLIQGYKPLRALAENVFLPINLDLFQLNTSGAHNNCVLYME